MNTLPATFRIQRSGPFKGSITAVFPTIPSGYAGRDMECYTMGEGHCGCSSEWYYRDTRLATEAEYVDTLAALRRIYENGDDPVRLVIVKRITRAMNDEFHAEQRRARESLRDNPAGAPWVL